MANRTDRIAGPSHKRGHLMLRARKIADLYARYEVCIPQADTCRDCETVVRAIEAELAQLLGEERPHAD